MRLPAAIVPLHSTPPVRPSVLNFSRFLSFESIGDTSKPVSDGQQATIQKQNHPAASHSKYALAPLKAHRVVQGRISQLCREFPPTWQTTLRVTIQASLLYGIFTYHLLTGSSKREFDVA